MIKNDRQYRMTKANVRTFADAIAGIKSQPVPTDIDPRLSDIQQRALESQLQEMTFDVNEYEALKAGEVTSFEAESLAELPTLFVKARIARGLTHKGLAQRLKVKEQQVQRWESNDFAGASIETLKAITEALGIALRQQMFVPTSHLTSRIFLASLAKVGISPEFIFKRIVPPRVASLFRAEAAGLKEIVITANAISRIFGLKVIDLINLKSPLFDFSAIGTTRFKLPPRANQRLVNAYTLYAHYLSALLVDCVESKSPASLPANFHEFHQAVTDSDEPLTFEGVIRFFLSCGIIVLPLRDSGGFHGAVWKIRGRFVIALKQRTDLESRWLYDAVHEMGHIQNGDVTDDIFLIEEREISPDAKEELEEKANEWAENALFDGRSAEIEEACTRACNGHLKKLKGALPKVAGDFNANLGSLANHMAFRLAERGDNWWGAAHNLQMGNRSPFIVARDILFQHINLFRLSSFDRELLQNALSEE